MKLAVGYLTLLLAIGVSETALGLDFTGLTGSGAPVTNMQPSLAMTYVIRTAPSSYYFSGEIGLFAGNVVPSGWTVADGRMLDVNANSTLWNVISTNFGSNGASTFALPDLRGRSAFGAGAGAGLTNRTLASTFGSEQTSVTRALMPAHVHTLPQGGLTASVGSGQPQPNLQPGLVLNYSLCTQGVFPTAAPGTASGDRFLGEVELSAGPAPFSGHAMADGELLPKNQNTALFSLLGTTYGGNGTTNFAAPDLRGRQAIHQGQGPTLSNHPEGEMVGAEQVTMTAAQLPSHTHTLSPTGSTGATGGNQPVPNMGPSLAVNYIIATSGLDPFSQAASDGTFMGQLRLFAGNFAPTGFAFAEGQLLAIGDYPELFGVLGTTYGGDGVSTFALPDLRGRTPIGTGSGVGLTDRSLGMSLGAESVSLAVSNLPSHSHAISVAGDFNFNGIVDAADYVVWLKGLGTTYTQNDYSLWRSHFGQFSATGTDFEADAVPEPACSLLTMTIAGALLQSRVRKKRTARCGWSAAGEAGRIEVPVQRRPA